MMVFGAVAGAQPATRPTVVLEAKLDQTDGPARMTAESAGGLLVPGDSSLMLFARWFSDPVVEEPDWLTGEGDVPARLRATRSVTVTWTVPAGQARSLGEDGLMWRATDSNGVPVPIEVVLEEQRALTIGTDGNPSERTRTGTERVTLLPGLVFDRDGDGMLGGAFVGVYPNELNPNAPAPVANNPRTYTPPRSFYRLDDSTAALRLSPNATLATFAPEVFASEGGGARFVAVSPELIRFWETLHRVTGSRRRAVPGELRVLRGFVSPHERQRLQRLGIPLAEFSRYQYGDALAIILDANRDYRMDDLNNDGRIDIADAEMLAGFIEQALADAGLAGGIGVCASFEGPNHIGTPYVHVDLRGWNLRWREE
jgi:hypothetical protein